MKKCGTMLLLVLLLTGLLVPAASSTHTEGTLYRGIKGHEEQVTFLQYQLFYGGYLGDDIAEVDGVFGKKTEEAVKAFQKAKGLPVTGVVDAATRALLDADWESGMESQGGEDESAPYCYVERYANGTCSTVLCARHMHVYAAAADAVSQAGQQDEQIIEGLQTGITFWMEELESLYQQWATLHPEYAPQLAAHQEAFMDYYRAQLAVWNAHFGAPSMAALERAQEMLADHCTELCIILGGVL